MKRLWLVLLATTLVLSFVSCADSTPIDEMTNDGSSFDGDEVITIAPDVSANSMAGHLWDAFLKEVTANENVTMEALAATLVQNSLIRFEGMATPVEPGLLAGFDNYEVTGFRSGAMFGPMIGSIAFVGYVFELEDGVDAQAFVDGLKQHANLRWQVCVSAGQMAVGAHGGIVFFVMCPGGTA